MLHKNTDLEELCISGCSCTTSKLSKFYLELGECPNLTNLDLSSNRLDYTSGSMIGKIISSQCEKKNESIWLHGLRNEPPPIDLHKRGLCEVNLEKNQLDDTAAEDICKFLCYDKYLRSLNLRKNKIELRGCLEFVKLLSKNDTLLSLDMRDNPGFNRKLSNVILEKLSSNMETFKKDLVRHEQTDSPEIPSEIRQDLLSPERLALQTFKSSPSRKKLFFDIGKRSNQGPLIQLSEEKGGIVEEIREKELPVEIGAEARQQANRTNLSPRNRVATAKLKAHPGRPSIFY